MQQNLKAMPRQILEKRIDKKEITSTPKKTKCFVCFFCVKTFKSNLELIKHFERTGAPEW